MEIVNLAIELLAAFCEEHKIPEHHGLAHYKAVLKHAIKAGETFKDLTDAQKLAIYLAALLHDVDDRKLFAKSVNYENARMLLAKLGVADVDIELIIKMISLVSFSSNGNGDDDGEIPEWMLIPRLADRLESIGIIGVKRCYEFTLDVGRPLFREDTPRFYDVETMLANTKARQLDYVAKKGKVGESSFIDHFYDKLIHLGLKTNIDYFNKKSDKRMQAIFDVALLYGKQGYITNEQITSSQITNN